MSCLLLNSFWGVKRFKCPVFYKKLSLTPSRVPSNRLRTPALSVNVFWMTLLTCVRLENVWGTRLCATHCTDYCNVLQQPARADWESGLNFSWLPVSTLFLQTASLGFLAHALFYPVDFFFSFFNSHFCSAVLKHFLTAKENGPRCLLTVCRLLHSFVLQVTSLRCANDTSCLRFFQSQLHGCLSHFPGSDVVCRSVSQSR